MSAPKDPSGGVSLAASSIVTAATAPSAAQTSTTSSSSSLASKTGAAPPSATSTAAAPTGKDGKVLVLGSDDSEITEDMIVTVMRENTNITVQGLIRRFREQLNHPTLRGRNREAFRTIIDRVAEKDDSESGSEQESKLILKPEYLGFKARRSTLNMQGGSLLTQLRSPRTGSQASVYGGHPGTLAGATNSAPSPDKHGSGGGAGGGGGSGSGIHSSPGSHGPSTSTLNNSVTASTEDSQAEEDGLPLNATQFRIARMQRFKKKSSTSNNTTGGGGSGGHVRHSEEGKTVRQRWLRAACARSLPDLKTMMEREPNIINARDIFTGYTALHWASKFGDVEMLLFLRTNMKHLEINARTFGGQTALHLACQHGQTSAADTLKAMGIDEEIRDNGGRLAAELIERFLRRGSSMQLDLDNVPEPSSFKPDASEPPARAGTIKARFSSFRTKSEAEFDSSSSSGGGGGGGSGSDRGSSIGLGMGGSATGESFRSRTHTAPANSPVAQSRPAPTTKRPSLTARRLFGLFRGPSAASDLGSSSDAANPPSPPPSLPASSSAGALFSPQTAAAAFLPEEVLMFAKDDLADESSLPQPAAFDPSSPPRTSSTIRRQRASALDSTMVLTEVEEENEPESKA